MSAQGQHEGDVRLHEKVAALDRHVEVRFEGIMRALEDRFTATEKYYAAVFASQEKAIMKAEKSADERALAANELRTQLSAERMLYQTKAETDTRLLAITEKIDALTERFSVLDRRSIEWFAAATGKSSGISAAWGVLLGAVGFVAAMISILFK